MNRHRFLGPNGESSRAPGRTVAGWAGHMVHVDVKNAGRIPDGGDWRKH
ncbi:hypothetical protein [Rhodococcus sp. T2V]|nr:hypothetical protein [Rhodococcus sp. T2V]